MSTSIASSLDRAFCSFFRIEIWTTGSGSLVRKAVKNNPRLVFIASDPDRATRGGRKLEKPKNPKNIPKNNWKAAGKNRWFVFPLTHKCSQESFPISSVFLEPAVVRVQMGDEINFGTWFPSSPSPNESICGFEIDPFGDKWSSGRCPPPPQPSGEKGRGRGRVRGTISSRTGVWPDGVVLAVKPTLASPPSVRGWKKGGSNRRGKVFSSAPLSPSSFGLLRGKRLDPLLFVPFRFDRGKVTPTSHPTTIISLPREQLR